MVGGKDEACNVRGRASGYVLETYTLNHRWLRCRVHQESDRKWHIGQRRGIKVSVLVRRVVCQFFLENHTE